MKVLKYEKVFFDFVSWLEGIVEDDPIPLEVKSFSFFINNNFEIGFSASEQELPQKIDLGFYFPLESEYFYSRELIEFINQNSQNIKSEMLKILKCLLNEYKKKKNCIYKNKRVFYGFLFENANLLK